MEAIAKILEQIGAKRLWLFFAITATCAGLLFLPDINGLPFSAVRKQYEAPLIAGLLAGGALFISGAVSDLAAWLHARGWGAEGVRITPDRHKSNWGIHEQTDGETASHFHAHVQLYNPTKIHLRLLRADLTWPLHRPKSLLSAMILVSSGPNSNTVYSSNNTVPPSATRHVGIDVILRGNHGGRGWRTLVRFVLKDQTGKKYGFWTWLNDPTKPR